MLLPMMQHTEASQRADIQLKASLPRRKQAWQQIVSEKLRNQRDFLDFLKVPGVKRLDVLSQTVLSGDSSNNEAQGAKVYFESIYGTSFIRSDEDNAINSKLDYGYTILRSAVARAVVDTGLLPSCGVFHSSRINPFCLVDDLMEPFRAMVDSLVLSMCSKFGIVQELEPREKKELMRITARQVAFEDQEVEFSYALRLYILSYLGFLARNRDTIQFPKYSYAWTV
jgi:CRISPR-associated protein Cas1